VVATKLDAAEILSQAVDTIKATYWIQNDEVEHDAYGISINPEFGAPPKWWKLGMDTKKLARALAKDLEIPKLKVLSVEEDDTEGWTQINYITGVCSIGAMALAEAVTKNEHLTEFHYLYNNDWEHHIAARALASAVHPQVLQERHIDDDWGFPQTAPSFIAGWNDKVGRKKSDVVKAFNQAIIDPMLDWKQYWTLANGNGMTMPVSFRTKAEVLAYEKSLRTGTGWLPTQFQEQFAIDTGVHTRWSPVRKDKKSLQ
jgi:hypothetical protein